MTTPSEIKEPTDTTEPKRLERTLTERFGINWKVSLTKWSTIRDTYSSSTGTISTQLRTYALAGFAIVWLFKTGDGSVASPYVLDENLLIGAMTLIVFIGLDMLQYLYKIIAWDWPRRNATEEKASPDDEDLFYVWDQINSIATILFGLKVLALIIGYVWIFRHVWAVLYP